MEIIGAVVTTAGLINGVIKIGTTISDLKQKWTYASLNISLFSSSLIAVKAALQEISAWRNTENTQTQRSEQLDQDLEVCMESCAVLIAVVERKLKDIDLENISKYEKARFISLDALFKDFQDHLDAQVRALQLLLTIHQCRTLSEQNEKLQRIKTRKAVSAVRESAASLNYEERDIEDAASILSEAPSQSFAFDNAVMQHHSYSRAYPRLFARMQENFLSANSPRAQQGVSRDNSVFESEDNDLVTRNNSSPLPNVPLSGHIKTESEDASVNLGNVGRESSSNHDDAATIKDVPTVDVTDLVGTEIEDTPNHDPADPPVPLKTPDERHKGPDRHDQRSIPKSSTPEGVFMAAQTNTSEVQQPRLPQDGLGSVLFQDFINGASRTTARFGARTRKWFGETPADPSKILPASVPRQVQIANYQPVNLCLPLKQQFRNNRIAKRLEDSKDKTEFWMPALPWRCIDYLNFKGCEDMHLYAAPGSNRDLEKWWQKFDQEGDINLFNQADPVDVKVIGSLLKRWFRSLPDNILDQDIQKDLSIRYSNQEKAPDELREILSKLLPWDYYLLFAITCHLSLLTAYEDINKISTQSAFFRFGSALRLNAKCFSWLIGDWRSCWAGCTTEKETLEDEYRILSGSSKFHIPELKFTEDLLLLSTHSKDSNSIEDYKLKEE